jgi:nitrogen-specific signal transduction histidine kinase
VQATPRENRPGAAEAAAQSDASAALPIVAAVGKATEALFAQVLSESWDMTPALQLLGETLGAEGVYAFKVSAHAPTQQPARRFHHWHAPSLEREPLAALPVGDPDFASWRQKLSQGKVVSGCEKDFTPPQRAYLNRVGIRSLALAPMLVNRRIWGLLGFLDFSRARIWDAVALESLKIIACVSEGLAWRREYARALRESEERYRTLFDNSPVETIVVDEQARVVMYNRAKKTARTRLPEIGDVMYKDYAGHHKTDLHKELLDCIHTNSAKVFPDLPYEDRYLNIRISPLRSGAVITAIDITAYKKTERELEESRQQLYQSQKMEALGTLVAGAAHEINNPVNLIQFNIPLLGKVWQDLIPVIRKQEQKKPGAKYGGLTCAFLEENLEQLLADVDMAANRISKIVNDLKGFSRQSDVKDKEPICVNDAVRNAVRLSGTTLKKARVTLELDLAEKLPPIKANIHSIEQIILNITINAVQAIHHEKGRIRIATTYDSRRAMSSLP